MSGIVGIHNLDGKAASRKDLEKMVDILAHRGPDGADIWVEGSVGLGHRMLWTTPESLLEKLPFIDESSELVITSDARIDNREELIDILHLNSCPVETITDSQLILAAYKKWGNFCPEHLLGDFAFVIWDQRNQSLFCARDHFGIKPFYYYYKPDNTFAFVSEIKALFTLKQVPRCLNETRMGDYLAFMMEDQVTTSYQDIFRLPPAHCMVVSQELIQVWSYWSLDPNREIKLPSNEAYAKEFKRIFSEAVHCRLRSAFPIISHLSGGLDSSAITCVARSILVQEGKTPLHTISTIYDKIKECDERAYINTVIDQGGLTPHFVHGDVLGPLSNLDMIFKYEDEAFIGPSHFYPWLVNRETKQLGMRIALDGFDGDTTVSHGITRLKELASQGKWNTFFHEAKAVSPNYDVSVADLFKTYGFASFQKQAQQWQLLIFLKAVQLIHKNFDVSRKHLILNYGVKPLKGQVRQFLKNLFRKHRSLKRATKCIDSSQSLSVLNNPLINNNFAEKISLNERITMMELNSKAPESLRREHWQSLTVGLMAYTFEQMDQYAAMFSIESRHPFMDKRLIEFCLALPSEQKLFNGYGRMVMRRALEGVLPEKVQWRGDKTDMSANFDDGLFNRNRQILDEVMSSKIQNIEKYINLEYLQNSYQKLVLSEDKINNNEWIIVWQSVIISLWLDYKKIAP
jgi:asparagine synthase (glutamine-hydrolysing)